MGITGLEAASGTTYNPRWSEIAITLSIVAVGFAVFRVVAHYFPVFEAASHQVKSGKTEAKEADPVIRGMNLRKKFRLGLAAKVAVCVIASTAAFFTLFGWINLDAERRQFQEQVEQSANRVADVIARSTRYQMLKNDADGLKNIVHELGTEPGMYCIRIVNQQGRIAYSTGAQETPGAST